MGKEIHVPALIENGRIILPEFYLSYDIEFGTDEKGAPVSGADYQVYKPPTLAESRHAYFTKTADGGMLNPEYKQSVHAAIGRGEWTSTILRDGKEIVERPERVFYDEKHNLWIAEGGKISPVEVPPEGYVLEYDRPTGLPSRTSQNRKDAEKVFCDDTSVFYRELTGLRIIVRSFPPCDLGPFAIYADFEPNYKSPNIGIRLCRR